MSTKCSCANEGTIPNPALTSLAANENFRIFRDFAKFDVWSLQFFFTLPNMRLHFSLAAGEDNNALSVKDSKREDGDYFSFLNYGNDNHERNLVQKLRTSVLYEFGGRRHLE